MFKIYRVPDELPCNATPEKPLKVVASAKSSRRIDFMWVSLMLHHPTHIYRNIAYYRNEAEYDVSQVDFLGDLSLVRVMKCSKELENSGAQYIFREFKRMLNAYEKNGGRLRLNFDTWEVLEPLEDGSLRVCHTLSEEG